MNKIISMSVWGTNPRYIIGAIRQIQLAKKYYPDWKVRIYTDNVNNFSNIKECEICEITDNSYGMFWRFLPMFENNTNITMVRDSDSRITIREHMCIEEWLNSKENFHIFRDHEAHFEFPIIGCAFAFKGKFDSATYDIMKNYMNTEKYYLSDQFFLRDYIYPLIKDDIMVHSMYDGWFGESRKLLKNKYSFCGNGYDENDIPLYGPSLTDINPPTDTNKYKFDNGVLNK